MNLPIWSLVLLLYGAEPCILFERLTWNQCVALAIARIKDHPPPAALRCETRDSVAYGEKVMP